MQKRGQDWQGKRQEARLKGAYKPYKEIQIIFYSDKEPLKNFEKGSDIIRFMNQKDKSHNGIVYRLL